MASEESGKKRKTLDEYLGISPKNTTLIILVAIVTTIISGGILGIVSPVLGLYSVYFIYKERNNKSISRNTRIIQVILLLVWFILFDLASQLNQKG